MTEQARLVNQWNVKVLSQGTAHLSQKPAHTKVTDGAWRCDCGYAVSIFNDRCWRCGTARRRV